MRQWSKVQEVLPVSSASRAATRAGKRRNVSQSAAGLAADLNRCADQLRETGRIETFELGRSDASGVLRMPQKLYGREPEIAHLLASFERVQQGAAELLLIAGPSGVGKSALVQELHKLLVLHGHFAAGKFDQLNRALPYAPIAAVCRELLRALLAKPPAALERWAERKQCASGCCARGAMRAMRSPGSRTTRGAPNHAPSPPSPDLRPVQAPPTARSRGRRVPQGPSAASFVARPSGACSGCNRRWRAGARRE
jgi:hypothetical protein